MEINDPRLDYIKIIAHKYCSPFGETNEKALCTEIDYNVTEVFSHQIEKLLEKYKDKHESYISNEKIQSSINTFGLDAEKLWITILFVIDFVEGCFCLVTRRKLSSVREMAGKMLDIYDDTSLIIKVESKKGQYETKFIEMNRAFKKFLEGIYNSKGTYYDTREVDWHYDGDLSTAKLAYFTEILQYLLNKKYTAKKPSKLAFIAKLAYILDYTNDERFINEYELVPIKTSIDRKLAELNGKEKVGNKEFYKNTIDTGKLLSDMIKKNRTQPDPGGSNYMLDLNI